jgi:drug/metabolite transporter (DMT)-like permease
VSTSWGGLPGPQPAPRPAFSRLSQRFVTSCEKADEGVGRGPGGPSHTLLYTLIALMVFFWSANYIIGKIALREFPALLLAGLRICLAGLFILPAYIVQGGAGNPACSRLSSRLLAPGLETRDFPILFSLGVFGVTLNQVFFVVGLSRTSVVHAVLIVATTPILVLAIAAIIKQEQITVRKATGMLIALVGVAILNALPASTAPGASPTLIGDAFVLLSALTFAMFTVLGKKARLRHSSVTVNAFAYVGGALALAPLVAWQGRTFSYGLVSTLGWSSLIYMALFPSVISYLIYGYALGHISASRVSAFSYLQPVIATALATVTLGERVTLPLVAGGAVIFSGVYLTERG